LIKFTIPGEPKAKARPRMTKAGHTYTPKTTVDYENWIKCCYIESKNKLGFKKSSEPIKAEITCYFPIPKSYSKVKKESALNGEIRPCKKPDVDNLAKSILDALNNLAYDDDKQVVELEIVKFYSDEPRTEVFLTEI